MAKIRDQKVVEEKIVHVLAEARQKGQSIEIPCGIGFDTRLKRTFKLDGVQESLACRAMKSLIGRGIVAVSERTVKTVVHSIRRNGEHHLQRGRCYALA